MGKFCLSTDGWKHGRHGLCLGLAMCFVMPAGAQENGPAPQATAAPATEQGREVDLASPPRIVDEPKPTAAPAPAPGPSDEMPVAPPPLSLADAINSVRSGVDLLERPSTIPLEKKRERIEFMLGSVIRYVERNPLRANMVQRSQDWEWSSLKPTARCGPDGLL